MVLIYFHFKHVKDQVVDGVFDSVSESSTWKIQPTVERTVSFTKSAGNILDMW